MVFVKNTNDHSVVVTIFDKNIEDDDSSEPQEAVRAIVTPFEMKEVQYPQSGIGYMVVDVVQPSQKTMKRMSCAFIPTDSDTVLEVKDSEIYSIMDGDVVVISRSCDLDARDRAFVSGLGTIEGFENPSSASSTKGWNLTKILLVIGVMMLIAWMVWYFKLLK